MQNHSFICIILLLFFSACLFSSFVQDSVANLIGLKTTYIFGLAMFGLSMFFTVVFPSVVVLNICAAFSGLGFAVATTIPCSLLTRYHQQPDLFFRDTRPIGAFTGKNLWIRGLLMSVMVGIFRWMKILGRCIFCVKELFAIVTHEFRHPKLDYQ